MIFLPSSQGSKTEKGNFGHLQPMLGHSIDHSTRPFAQPLAIALNLKHPIVPFTVYYMYTGYIECLHTHIYIYYTYIHIYIYTYACLHRLPAAYIYIYIYI